MVVRVASSSDAGAFAEIYRPIVTGTVISFEEEPPSTQEMVRRLSAILERTPWLTAEENGAVIGYAYASAHRDRAAYRWAVDVSAYVHESARGRGGGRALYTALLAILKAQGFYRAYAGVALPNEASIALHRAVGFEPIGVYKEVGWKFGAWHDVMWLGRVLNNGPSSGEPSEPIAFPAWLASNAGRLPAAGDFAAP